MQIIWKYIFDNANLKVTVNIGWIGFCIQLSAFWIRLSPYIFKCNFFMTTVSSVSFNQAFQKQFAIHEQ